MSPGIASLGAVGFVGLGNMGADFTRIYPFVESTPARHRRK